MGLKDRQQIQMYRQILEDLPNFSDINTLQKDYYERISKLSDDGIWSKRFVNNFIDITEETPTKFHNIDRYVIKPQKSNVKWEKKLNICVVYTLWGPLQYLKFLYLSLLSQFLYTDVLNVTVKVLVHRNTFLYRATKNLLSIFNDPDMVIPVNESIGGKYIVPTLDCVKDFDIVINFDTDGFMWFDQPTNIYQKIWDYYNKDKDNFTFYCFSDYIKTQTIETGLNVAYDQYRKSGYNKDKSRVEFYKIMTQGLNIDLPEYLPQLFWMFGYFTIMKREFFDSEFIVYATKLFEHNIICDESAFLMWLIHKEEENKDIRQILPDFRPLVGEMNEHQIFENEFKYFAHPVSGENVLNLNNIKFFNKLESDAWKKISL